MEKSCKICGHKTSLIVHQKFGNYHHCSYCGFIFKDPDSYISANDALEIYNTHNNHIGDPKYIAYFQRFLDAAVFPFVPPKPQALDFGSGPEPVLATLLSQEYGYDIDIYDRFYAPSQEYQNKKYDLIITTEVVEHLDDPLKYFGLFAQLLNEGGVLAVMTSFQFEKEECFLNWYYIRDRSHISFYNPRTFGYLASQLGLKIIYCNDKNYITLKKESA